MMLSHTRAVPQGEGERMVMDLQDVTSSLADGISKSNIRLFDTSAAPLAVDQSDSEEEFGESDISDDSSLGSDVDSELDGADSESSGDEAHETIHLQNTGRTSIRRPPRSAHDLPLNVEQQDDAAYASSDSDMGELDNSLPDDQEGDDDESESEQEEGDDNVPRWKSNLGTKALTAFTQHTSRRRDWTKLIYQSDLTLAEILAGASYASQNAETGPDAGPHDEFRPNEGANL